MTAGCVLLVTLVAGLALTPSQSLEVKVREGSSVICQRVSNGEVVDLVFTNSIFGGEVRESYEVSGEALRRVSFVAEREAAAEYYAWTLPIEQTASGFEVMLPDQVFRSVPVRVDTLGAYRIAIGGESHDISGTVDSPTSMVIELESHSLIAGWLEGC